MKRLLQEIAMWAVVYIVAIYIPGKIDEKINDMIEKEK